MDAVVALPTLDHLRRMILETLCYQDRLDPNQTPFYEGRLMRRGKLCGLIFEIHGPRLVKSSAIWVEKENRILFYDSTGQRFRESRLSEAPLLAKRAA